MNSINIHLIKPNNNVYAHLTHKISNTVRSKTLTITALINIIISMILIVTGIALLSWPIVTPGAILFLIMCSFFIIKIFTQITPLPINLSPIPNTPYTPYTPYKAPITVERINNQNTLKRSLSFSFEEYKETIKEWFHKKTWSFESLNVSSCSLLSTENEALTIKNNHNQILLTLVKHSNISIPFNITNDDQDIAIFNEINFSILKKKAPDITKINDNKTYDILKSRPCYLKNKKRLTPHEAIEEAVNDTCWNASIKNHAFLNPGDSIGTPWQSNLSYPTGFTIPNTLIQIIGPHIKKNEEDVCIIKEQLNIVFKAYQQAFNKAHLMKCSSIQLPLIGNLSFPKDKTLWTLGCYLQLLQAINELPKFYNIKNIILVEHFKKPIINQIIIDHLVKKGML